MEPRDILLVALGHRELEDTEWPDTRVRARVRVVNAASIPAGELRSLACDRTLVIIAADLMNERSLPRLGEVVGSCLAAESPTLVAARGPVTPGNMSGTWRRLAKLTSALATPVVHIPDDILFGEVVRACTETELGAAIRREELGTRSCRVLSRSSTNWRVLTLTCDPAADPGREQPTEHVYEPLELVRIRTALKQCFVELDQHYRSGRKKIAATGLDQLDERCGSLAAGDLVAIAGPPLSGKTAAALAVVRHVARSTSPLLFFARGLVEMDLYRRLLSEEAAIEPWALPTGNLDREAMAQVSEAANVLARGPIRFSNMAETTLEGFQDVARRWRRATFSDGLGDSPGLIIVDDLDWLAQRVGLTATALDRDILLSRLAGVGRSLWSAVIVLCRTEHEAGPPDTLAGLERHAKAVIRLGV